VRNGARDETRGLGPLDLVITIECWSSENLDIAKLKVS